MTRQHLITIRVERQLHARLGILAEKEHRTKLDELRFLIGQREMQLNLLEMEVKNK